MTRLFAAVSLAALLCAPIISMAQESKPTRQAPSAPRVGKDQKLCQYKFPDGEKRSWVCDKVQPCCAWDAIKYVKCGSTITKCL